MSLRDDLSTAMKQAMKSGDKTRLSVVRMIQATLKDKDIDARGGEHDGRIPDNEILLMLQKMIKQAQEAAVTAAKAGRSELVDQARAEIEIITSFLPTQMDEDEVRAVVSELVGELGATSIKDMGKVMAAIKERYFGRIDAGKAGPIVRAALVS